MRRQSTKRILIALLVVMSMFALMRNTPSAIIAQTEEPFTDKFLNLQLDFEQQYKPSSCPIGSPAGAFCIAVTGTAHSATFGDISLKRTIALDVGAKPNEYGGSPAQGDGTLNDKDGDTVEFHLSGVFYSSTQIANYLYVVTSGTGKFKDAKGTGAVIVPPPLTSSTGTEIWLGNLKTILP